MEKQNLPQPEDIRAMPPEKLLQQFRPLVLKMANKYIKEAQRLVYIDADDLFQVGFEGLLIAQKIYNPEGGANFLTFAYKIITHKMMRLLGWRWSAYGELIKEPTLCSLDKPISDDDQDDTTRLDMIPDPTIRPFDEPLIEEETRQETAVEVRAALARLKSDRQRDIIGRIYFDGQERKNIAARYGVSHQTISSQVHDAFRKLRHDMKLRRYAADTVPFFHVGANRFNSTWTSAVEAAVIWRDEHLPQDRFTETEEPERVWTAAQWNAYLKRLRKKMERLKELADGSHDPRNVQTSTLTETRQHSGGE